MTTAIHYTHINLSETRREIFGLQVAVSNWMKAFFRYSTQDKFNFLIGDGQGWDEIQHMAGEVKLDPSRLIALDSRYARENFGSFDAIFRADPHPQNIFWQRQQVPNGFSFCGLAHAISGLEAGELLERYCLHPSEETDAIVCPSRAVQSAIKSFFDLYGDYVKERFGASFKCPVQLPIIPLGVDIEHFERITTPEKRAEQRQKLGLGADDVVLLWVGRLSHAIKAHPLAMFQAAEMAAEKTGANVHLVMVGYFAPEDAEPKFEKLAADICKKAKVSFIRNHDPHFPDGLWAAGDIFFSLIDNMQESFGLTPIEAMAAGLPRVISDWDGYRDSVTDGEDGFLVRTLQPPPGAGKALSELLLSGQEIYGGFLAKSALSVAVDAEMAAKAIRTLITDKNLRKNMADKARVRVKQTYDWKNIIPAYENLWKELAAKRKASKPQTKSWPSALPQAPDPYTMYASYASSRLDEKQKLAVAVSTDTIKKLWTHEINVFGMDMMVGADDTAALINHVATGGATIGTLFRQFPALDKPSLWRTIGWLLKLGILRIS